MLRTFGLGSEPIRATSCSHSTALSISAAAGGALTTPTAAERALVLTGPFASPRALLLAGEKTISMYPLRPGRATVLGASA